jgi:hypothetical protein
LFIAYPVSSEFFFVVKKYSVFLLFNERKNKKILINKKIDNTSLKIGVKNDLFFFLLILLFIEMMALEESY